MIVKLLPIALLIHPKMPQIPNFKILDKAIVLTYYNGLILGIMGRNRRANTKSQNPPYFRPFITFTE